MSYLEDNPVSQQTWENRVAIESVLSTELGSVIKPTYPQIVLDFLTKKGANDDGVIPKGAALDSHIRAFRQKQRDDLIRYIRLMEQADLSAALPGIYKVLRACEAGIVEEIDVEDVYRVAFARRPLKETSDRLAELPPGYSWPTEKYIGKCDGEDIKIFLGRVWRELIASGADELRWLRRVDYSAYKAIERYEAPDKITGERTRLPPELQFLPRPLAKSRREKFLRELDQAHEACRPVPSVRTKSVSAAFFNS